MYIKWSALAEFCTVRVLIVGLYSKDENDNETVNAKFIFNSKTGD